LATFIDELFKISTSEAHFTKINNSSASVKHLPFKSLYLIGVQMVTDPSLSLDDIHVYLLP
jgi:hypothetical protein